MLEYGLQLFQFQGRGDAESYRLELKTTYPKMLSYAVSKVFLATIKVIGVVVPHYVRINGEVY